MPWGLRISACSINVVTSCICMLPGAIAYTYLGYAGRNAIAGYSGHTNLTSLMEGWLAGACSLFRATYVYLHFTERNTKCIRHSFAISWIGFYTVIDMPDFDFPRGITQGAGGVAE